MTSSTVDSKSISNKVYSCHIAKLEFVYTDEEKKEKKTVLYNGENRKTASTKELPSKEQSPENAGKLLGRVTNQKDKEFFFITNNKGKKVKINCSRKVNDCQDDRHLQYDYDYIDINTRELKTIEKLVDDGDITLYYFDIFNRTWDYAKNEAVEGAKKGYNSSDNSLMCVAKGTSKGILGLAEGAVEGHFSDLIMSLRFIHLPKIESGDNTYGCYTVLAYRECLHRPSVPEIIINTYPDIEFNLKLGFLGYSKSHTFKTTKADSKNKTERTPFSFEFVVKYGGKEKNITFDKKIEEKDVNNEEEKKGSKFANTIFDLKNFLEKAAEFTDSLKQLVEYADAGDKEALKKYAYKPKGSDWLKGSLEISPELSAEWKYSVSDDLTKVGRYIKLELSAECTGKITIDLIEVGTMLLSKSKKAAKVTALASSVASGGIAALPAALITFLVDYVVDWLIDEFKEGLVFDLILIGKATFKAGSLTFDTSKKDIFEAKGLSAEIKPEIQLVMGLDYKADIELFLFVKAEGEVKATAEAAASLTWEMKLNVKEGYLGVDHDLKINPFTLKIEYSISGSFTVSDSYEFGSKGKNKVHEWKSEEIKYDTKRHNWMKVGGGQNSNGYSSGDGSGGGVTSSWK